MNQQVIHPMEKLQGQVKSLINSNLIQPTDQLWKIAFLYEKDWQFLKKELLEFGFSMQDPISELILVDVWDED